MSFYGRVFDTTAYPYSAIVSIDVTYADGSGVTGSGAVVGRNDVLTSAHVVQPDDGSEVHTIEVTPAYDDGQTPFGKYEASHWTWYTIDEDGDGLLDREDVRWDYAVLTVEDPDPIGDATGWFGIQSDTTIPNQFVFLESAGYPSGPQSPYGDLEMFYTRDYEFFDGEAL